MPRRAWQRTSCLHYARPGGFLARRANPDRSWRHDYQGEAIERIRDRDRRAAERRPQAHYTTPDELARLVGLALARRLDARGLGSRCRLAALLGVRDRNVRRWCSGQTLPNATTRDRDAGWTAGIGCTFVELVREAVA